MNKTITTEEGNRLIAEFMQFPCPPVYDETPFGQGNGYGYYDVKELRYHSSYDWIMPAVEKIGREEYADKSWQGCEKYDNTPYPRTFGMRNSENGKYMVRFNAMPLFQADTLIEATWLAVVDYIQSLKQTS